MIIEPERYVEQFAKAGTDIFCFHIEATKNAKELVAKIKQLGMKVAVALKPATPISTIEELLPELDMVLVMTVEPGFGGQKFMEDQMEKVKNWQSFVASMITIMILKWTAALIRRRLKRYLPMVPM